MEQKKDAATPVAAKSGWVSGGLSEQAQADVLRRVARHAEGVSVDGAVTTVRMPNKSQVRITTDKAGTPIKWETMA